MDSSTVQILDTSDPTNPALIAVYSDIARATDLIIEDGIAYIADQAGWLRIVDLDDPKVPTLIGLIRLNSIPKDYIYQDGFVYIAADHFYFDIVDVRIPEAPYIVSSTWTNGVPNRLQIVGKTAYIANTSSLMVIDVSNPELPLIRDELKTTGSILGVSVDDRYAYVADEQEGLSIIDIHDVATNPILDTFELQRGTRDLTLVGSTSYIINDDRNLTILDASDPSAMTLLGSLALATPISDLAVHDQFAYLSSDEGLFVVDVSDPTSPALIQQYESFQDITNLQFLGSYLYGQRLHHLKIYDATDPLALVEVGEYSAETVPGEGIVQFTVEGTIAYLSSGIAINNQSLQIIDLSNPSEPELMSYWPFFIVGSELIVEDGIMYFGDDQLNIYDVRDPLNITQLSEFVHPLIAFPQVSFLDNGKFYMYLSATLRRRGIVSVDVSDPLFPTLDFVYPLNINPLGMAVSDETLFVTDFNQGLISMDVSDFCFECAADFNADERVSAADAILFVSLFLQQDPMSDLNGDGVLNQYDVSIFMLAFVDGCP